MVSPAYSGCMQDERSGWARGVGGGESVGGFSCLNRSPCISDRASRIGLRVCAVSSCSGPGLDESVHEERRGARSREETAVIFGSLFPRF
ncbi:unnamed protein product [Ectocarpus sp. 13 AM-2016]